MMKRPFLFALSLAVSAESAAPVAAQPPDPGLFSGLSWRLVGPFRGGRAVTATGVPGEPNRFYFGAVGGGVWKTDNAGRTWEPIFDAQPVASIGAIAVAPSDPNVLYVGSGEADMRSDISYGNGMYRSADGGRTWARIGLSDTRQIGRILVDPSDPNLVFVAALGHGYGPNAERGVFRSKDGGKSWTKVLYRDADTGAIDLDFQPGNARTILAALWQTRRPPWNVYPPSNGPGSGLFRSEDGGDTWEQVTVGLPTEKPGRMRVAFAPSSPKRVYVIADAKEGGLFVSEDAGLTFKKASGDPRIWGRGWYFAGVTVDPKDPDVVYACNTALFKSTDGGKTFLPWKGAPGGDDYHRLWIDPPDVRRMVVASDQGTVVTVDGGRTWSSWYNQPTAQFYHVATDDRFPYWIYGAQQDTGAAATPVRTDYRSITQRDWKEIAAGGENGYIQPDPSDPDLVWGGSVARFHWKTLQYQNVDPTLAVPGEYRGEWTLPLAISPRDPKSVYFGNQFLWKTVDGGRHWTKASPDLTREDAGIPSNLDAVTAEDSAVKGSRRSVIYAIAPSPLEADRVWCGTDDGLVWLTKDDGAHWENVTPKALTPWSKVAILEASHFDAGTVYAAVDRHRIDDVDPYLYRTRDGGKSLEPDREGNSARQLRERRARGPGAARSPLCRNGDGRLRILRRRRELAAPPAEPAELLDPRPRREARRPRRRDARALVLGARRRVAAPPARREDGRRGRLPLRAARGRAPPPGSLPGHPRAEGRADGREPEERRGPRLRAENRGGGPGRPRDPRREGRGDSPLFERRQDPAGGRDAHRDDAGLGRRLRAAVVGGRDAPLRLGPPRGASEGARDPRVHARRERSLGSAVVAIPCACRHPGGRSRGPSPS